MWGKIGDKYVRGERTTLIVPNQFYCTKLFMLNIFGQKILTMFLPHNKQLCSEFYMISKPYFIADCRCSKFGPNKGCIKVYSCTKFAMNLIHTHGAMNIYLHKRIELLLGKATG